MTIIKYNKLHKDELDIGLNIVSRLIKDQFPQWVGLSISPINSSGTDNVIFRIGEDMAMRLPRIASAALQIGKEFQWLPKLASHLLLAIPNPIVKGLPTDYFPYPWYIYRWLEGESVTEQTNFDLKQAAISLGHFVTALQSIDSTGAPIASRGKPLSSKDAETRSALKALKGIIDTDAATVAWDEALNAPEWNGLAKWIHGDLHPGNLLVNRNKISAVIDWGLAGVGDPACDIMVAWTVLTSEVRDIFRQNIQVDDAVWCRGQGWALTFGLVALPYYQKTNPVLADIAKNTINSVLSEKNN